MNTDIPKTILLVDDEQDIRDVLEMALNENGYRVITAADGSQALRLFEEQRPPVVLTDIKMPGMDGIDLLRRVKQIDPDTEVVMITGHGDMQLAVASFKEEAADFITKPINVDALEVALMRVREKIMMRQTLRDYTHNLEALVREKSELQDHLSSLGLMVGSISHGIKGLLTGLDGGMYLIDKGLAARDETRVQEGWRIVKRLVSRIRKLVMDILDYAKERNLEWEQVDVARFAEEMIDMVRPRLADQGIDLALSVDPALGELRIDPSYVHAALMNIIDNAADACRAATGTEAKVRLAVSQDDDNVVFTVQDNGVGMDEETVDRLFTAFFSSKGREGTGLGLFLAHKIVTQHGGRIEVSSKPRQGSTFRIYLPKGGN